MKSSPETEVWGSSPLQQGSLHLLCTGVSSKCRIHLISGKPHKRSWLLWHSPASLMCLYTSSLPAEEYGMSSWATKSIWRGQHSSHQARRFRGMNWSEATAGRKPDVARFRALTRCFARNSGVNVHGAFRTTSST